MQGMKWLRYDDEYINEYNIEQNLTNDGNKSAYLFNKTNYGTINFKEK